MRLALAFAALLRLGCTDTRSVDAGGLDFDAGLTGVDAAADAAADAMQPPPLFADIQYGVGCDETGGCVAVPNRDVCGIDGGDPCPEVGGMTSIACAVVEAGGPTRTISFTASQGGPFELAIEGAIVPFGGGSAGGSTCTVRVVEAGTAYSGACGSAPPSAAQPCQISDVVFCDDLGNRTILGELFCLGLPSESDPSQRLEIHSVGVGAMASMSPGRFRVANCPGLSAQTNICTF